MFANNFDIYLFVNQGINEYFIYSKGVMGSIEFPKRHIMQRKLSFGIFLHKQQELNHSIAQCCRSLQVQI